MKTPEPFSTSEEPLLRDGAHLRQLARRLVADDHLAEDLVQDGLLKSLGRVFRDPIHKERWLQRTVRNSAAESRRHAANAAARERITAREEALPSSEEVALRLEAIDLVLQSLRKLYEPYRSTLTHLFIDERSPREVARLEGVAENVVYKRQQRGLEMMRADLDRRAGGREGWMVPCLALARRPAGSVVETLRSWTRASPLAVAAVAGTLLGIGLIALLREHGSPAADTSDSALSPAAGIVARAETLPADGPQRAPASNAPIEVRVVRADTQQPVPAARIDWSPLPDDEAAEERIREWIAQGRIEEEMRVNQNVMVAEADGSALVPLVREGVLVVASSEGLWGFAIARPGATSLVRVEVYPDKDLEVLVLDKDGRPVEQASVSLSALGYYGEDLVTDLTDAQGQARLRHAGFAEESRKSRSPLLVDLSVGVPLGTWDINREGTPIVFRLAQPVAYANVHLVDADTRAPLSGRTAINAHGAILSAVDGFARVPIPVGQTIRWECDTMRTVKPDPEVGATVPGEHVTVTLTCRPPLERFACSKISGRLLALDESALTDQSISLHYAEESECSGLITFTRTDERGYFELDSKCLELSMGSDLWLADDLGGQLVRLRKDLHLPSLGDTDLGNIVLPTHDTLVQGRVVDSYGTPITGAQIQYLTAQSGEPLGYRRLVTHSLADGWFKLPKDHSEKDPDDVLLVTHPSYGPWRRTLGGQDADLVVNLEQPRRLAGKVLLHPSVSYENVWVEASCIEADLGWIKYHDYRENPPVSSVRSRLDASGAFELEGLGSGEYFFAVTYFGEDAFNYFYLAPPTLFSARFSLENDDPRARALQMIDLSSSVRFQRFDFLDTSGATVWHGELEVDGDDDYSTFIQDGEAYIPVQRGARILVSSKEHYPKTIDAWHEHRVVLDPRPVLNFELAGGLPELDNGFDLCLRVTAMDGSDPVNLDFYPEEPTTCLSPDRAGWLGTYLIQVGNDEEECGPALRAPGAPESTILLSPPDPKLVRLAIGELRARQKE